jgi:hypothetical protein
MCHVLDMQVRSAFTFSHTANEFEHDDVWKRMAVVVYAVAALGPKGILVAM